MLRDYWGKIEDKLERVERRLVDLGEEEKNALWDLRAAIYDLREYLAEEEVDHAA